ncbi:CLUMA_CG001198, isoform A [Clunio marinus]|uniref:CLUMA_CG001198, isoform A n=1 Tax=Clunio marinus TaxID=568069 RepID=A0A1J1HJ13_9DIPT|nr:CLUMA_CG001198, isoform A [Clunio marinus]
MSFLRCAIATYYFCFRMFNKRHSIILCSLICAMLCQWSFHKLNNVIESSSCLYLRSKLLSVVTSSDLSSHFDLVSMRQVVRRLT